MSQSLFEIRRVFQTNRPEIGKVVESGKYSIDDVIKEYGEEQLSDNLNSMLRKEAGLGPRRSNVNLHHNPVDYLKEQFQGKLKPEMREEAVLSIL